MSKLFTSLMVLLVLVSGCATRSLEADLPEKRPLARSYETFTLPSSPDEKVASPTKLVDVTGELTLDQAAALALLHNPRLQVFAWSVREAQALRLQAGLWPNPELDIEMENIGGSGPFQGTSNAETTVGIGQLIEVGGKRSKRSRVAALESELAGWDYEARRLAVFTEVTQAFAEVLVTQERNRILDQQVDLAEKVANAVAQRVQAGKDSPLEATKARVSLTQVRIEQKRSQRKLTAARQTLASTWGASQAQFTQVTGLLDHTAPPPEMSALEGLVVQHPDVARWDTEIKQRQARIGLAKANALPDPTVVGSYRRFNDVDESAFVLGLSLPLPVTNRNQGNILAAKVSLVQARRQRTAALTGIQSELSRAYADLSSAYSAANDLQHDVLPGAQEAFDSAQTGYQNGKFDYLTVLDAQRTLFTARMQYYDALVDYHKAKAHVEQLIGQSLAEVQAQAHQYKNSLKPINHKN